MSNLVRRPDLEAQSVSYPDYLVNKILPFYGRPKDAGSIYYQKFAADPLAQTGRNTANVAAINATTVASAKKSYTCEEVRGRIRMSYDQIRGYATKEAADLYMGRMAKRAFYNALELECAKLLLNGVGVPDGTADPVADIDNGISALRDKGIGRVAVVCSNAVFVALKNNATVAARMRNTGVAIDGLEPRRISPTQLAAVFGADDMLVGADHVWHSAGIQKGRVALCILPDEYAEPAEQVQLGRTVFFEWDSVDSKFIMESFHEDKEDAEYIDAKGLVDTLLLNADLKTTIQVLSTGGGDTSDSASGGADESTSVSASGGADESTSAG